jgi:hypothetical protein
MSINHFAGQVSTPQETTISTMMSAKYESYDYSSSKLEAVGESLEAMLGRLHAGLFRSSRVETGFWDSRLE